MGISWRWAWIAAAALLVACGDSPPGDAAPQTPSRPKPAAPSAAQLAAAKLIEGMVTAVKTDETPAVVAVKFDLRARPAAGQPLTIRLVFLPKMPAASLTSTFVSGQGLTVPAGQPPAEFSGVVAGAGYSYDLKVVPDSNGVHYVSAIVQLQTAGEPRIQTFSMPVIVGPPPT